MRDESLLFNLKLQSRFVITSIKETLIVCTKQKIMDSAFYEPE